MYMHSPPGYLFPIPTIGELHCDRVWSPVTSNGMLLAAVTAIFVCRPVLAFCNNHRHTQSTRHSEAGSGAVSY